MQQCELVSYLPGQFWRNRQQCAAPAAGIHRTAWGSFWSLCRAHLDDLVWYEFPEYMPATDYETEIGKGIRGMWEIAR